VAMTRAVEQLILIQYKHQTNPHIALLDKQYCSNTVSEAEQKDNHFSKFYTIGLKHLYLSYAAKMEPQSPNLRPPDLGDF